MELSRREFVKLMTSSGIALSVSHATFDQTPAFATRETLPGRQSWNPAATGVGRIDGLAKVTGAKLYASDFRAADLPGWPAATAPGHVGRLLLGRLAGTPIVMLQGRFHLYEGNDPGLVVQPVLLFKALGARVVVLTNAAGGLDPSFGPGTLMVMTDHINLTGRSPLTGPNADGLGPRFPDMTEAWSPRLRARLHAAGVAEGVELREGVYIGLSGPAYETPAEVRMLAALGGQAVGMSTVLECIAARWVGLEVCGVSLVTNAGAGYTGEPLTHEEVLQAGAKAGPGLARVIRRFVAELDDPGTAGS